MTHLERAHPSGPKVARSMLATTDEAMAHGTLIAGTVDEVRARIAEQLALLAMNYLVIGPAFGSMAHADSMRTLELFATDVVPRL